MNYRVIWDRRAFDRLLRQWSAAGKPESAIHAFDEIEKLLAIDAELHGESRVDLRRIVFVPPLGVIFEPHPDLGEVRIIEAWMIARRTP